MRQRPTRQGLILVSHTFLLVSVSLAALALASDGGVHGCRDAAINASMSAALSQEMMQAAMMGTSPQHHPTLNPHRLFFHQCLCANTQQGARATCVVGVFSPGHFLFHSGTKQKFAPLWVGDLDQ